MGLCCDGFGRGLPSLSSSLSLSSPSCIIFPRLGRCLAVVSGDAGFRDRQSHKTSTVKKTVNPVWDQELVFDVEPKKALIPPHEHRYVTCYFTPKAMCEYRATFEVNVEQGTNPATKQLRFDLKGEGTLPHVSVVTPTARSDETGQLLLQMPKKLVGRSAQQRGGSVQLASQRLVEAAGFIEFLF